MKLLKRIIIVYFTKIGKYIHPPPPPPPPPPPRPNQTRGGAAICLKPSINYVSQQIFNEQMQTIEMTCVKISFKDQQILNIWCSYVPPEKPKLMEELCNHINRKMSENTILVGDLNAKSYQ